MKELFKTMSNIARVDSAMNGKQAIEILLNDDNIEVNINNQPKSIYDFVLMDLNMPVMDGIQVRYYISFKI